MNLFFSPTSPYARIVRLALMEKDLTAQVNERQVNPWDGDPDLGAHNPIMRVPTLVTDDDLALTESLLIVQYLERQFPEPALIPGNAAPRILSLAGIGMGLIDSTVQLVLARRFFGAGDPPGPFENRRLDGIRRAIVRLEGAPPEPAGDILDLSGIVLGVALAYVSFRAPEVEWTTDHPGLANWLADVNLRPSMRITAPA